MRVGSLFSGIGGLDLGLEWAGMEIAWQVENNPFCQKVLKKHWPNVPLFEDVRNVGRNELVPVDVVCGGFPCQPHSVAGQRRGSEDDRDLWPEYRRIIDELRPRWVVGENVPGITNTILDEIFSDLEGLNYTWQTFDIPAGAVGAGHRRHRLFIIAYSGSERLENIVEMGAAPGSIERVDREHASLDRVPVVREFLVYDPSNPCPRLPVPGIGRVRRERLESIREATAWYEAQSGICGVVDGVPDRVDRIRSLGNAVVPQVAELIGRLIIEVEKSLEKDG
jgi:DNA (cytosine-5)-methyltransferase 1